MLVVCSFRCDNKACVTSLGEHKIVDVEIPVRNFKGIQEAKFSTLSIKTLDLWADDVKSIFEELALLEGMNELPIYWASCYNDRNIAGTNTLSKHAYGAAIDVNYYMNPRYVNPRYVNPLVDMTLDMRRRVINDITRDLSECTTTIPSDKVELFVQKYILSERGILYVLGDIPGTINGSHAEIFKKYGFDMWICYYGEQPTDMHFEISSQDLINNIIASDQETAQKLWNEHVEKCRESLKAQNKKERNMMKSLGI